MSIQKLTILAATALICGSVQAEDVKIAYVSGLTGPIASTAQDVLNVTQAYVSQVNANGGINGNKLVLVAKDDGYDPKKTAALVEEAIVNDHVVGLVNSAGTGPTIALIKSRMLNKYKVPLVGVFSGSEALRGEGSDEIFHTRPTYSEEIVKISRLAATLGLKRIAVLYQDDPFGQAVLKSVDACEKEFGLTILLKSPYKPGTKDFSEQAKSIIEAKPQSIFLMGVPDAVYQFMKFYNAPVGASQMFALSFVNPKALAEAAGEVKVRGVGISQVVPNPNSASIPLIKDFQALAKSGFGKDLTVNPTELEAYLNIRLMVDAIKLVGSHPTGEKVLSSLSSMQNYRVGNFQIDFSNTRRAGSDYLDIAVIGPKARLEY